MTTNHQSIDDGGYAADQPHDALLLQDIADNGAASREHRLRRGSVCWDVRDPPIICGGYRWARPDLGICRVVLPFLWHRSSMDVTQLTIRPRHTVVSGDVVVGVVALPLNFDGFPRVIPPNASESTETTRATALVTNSNNGLNVSVSGIVTQDVLLLLTFKSELTGAASAAVPVNDMEIPRLKILAASMTGGIASTSRPCMALTYDDKSSTYVDGDIPAPRQLIFIDDNGEDPGYLWVYPPHTQTGVTYPPIGATNTQVYYQTLSSVALYSVEIEETVVTDPAPYQAALNPGKPNDAGIIREACYRRHEKVFLEHTRVWAIGPPAPDPDMTDTNWSATQQLNAVHACAQWGQPDRAIASTYVGTTHRHESVQGVDKKVVGYRVRALVGITQSGAYSDADTITPDTVRLWLTLGNPGGFAAAITGDFRSYEVRPFVFSGSMTNQRFYLDPMGYLLRLHYPNQASPASPWPNSGQIAHALLGVYPEDVWHYGRPSNQGSSWILYEDTITDTSNSAQRKLTLWVDSATQNPDPHMYAHCVSWCVTTVQASNCDDLDTYAVAT